MLKKYNYYLKDLDCANCAAKIQDEISKNKDFNNVIVNFATLKLTVETDINNPKESLQKIISKIEPEVELKNYEENENKEKSEKTFYSVIKILTGMIFGILAIFSPFTSQTKNIFWIIAYAVLLYNTAFTAFKMLIKSKQINESFLITISCIGAFCLGEKLEGLMVIFLYEIGEALEENAVNHSRKSIKKLMNIKSEYANKKVDGNVEKVSPEDVKVGDVIVVKQGEKVPLDGTVVNGNTQIDTSALTGESKLTQVDVGSEILSGSINLGALIEIKVTKEYKNSTVYKILELVENATDKKAKTETFVAKGAKIYTPIVVLLAIMVATLLPIINKGITYSESIYRALAFLVISCPCAIAISVPLGYFSGIGRASKSGILIKGSQYLDNLNKIKEIIFDKTGTITTGSFNVYEITSLTEKYNKEQVLDYVAKGESFSNHPIAKSILNKVNYELKTNEVKKYVEISGKGMEYEIEDKHIKIGNASFVGIEEESIEGNTNVYLAINDETVGKIVIKDEVKKEAKDVIVKLKNNGISTKMFTGDNKEAAELVGKQVGMDEIKSKMLPQDKYEELEKSIKEMEKSKKCVAFVGDGINDSPVLARADVGISMGGVGSESAIEASDVVIMTDDLEKIPEAIKISNKTIGIIKQNLIFAIATKVIVLLLSSMGMAQMWQAVFADVGVTLITIFNTLRILKIK